MSSDQTANILYLLMAMALVASSLFARRLPLGQTFRMAFAWVAIFAAAFLLFSLRDDAGALWARLTSEANPSAGVTDGKTLRVRKSDDGHFWVRAQVNGHDVRFMVDSGATVIAMSVDAARSAGVTVSDSGFPVAIDTANGVVTARRATIDRLQIGPINRTALAATVAPEFGDLSVLGMNFLSSLSSWRVEGDILVLVP